MFSDAMVEGYGTLVRIAAFVVFVFAVIVGGIVGNASGNSSGDIVVGMLAGAFAGFIIDCITFGPALIFLGIFRDVNEIHKDTVKQNVAMKTVIDLLTARNSQIAQESRTVSAEQNKSDSEAKVDKRINTMEELLNDPEIIEGSKLMYKLYGKEAQEKYLQNKMEEHNIKA